MLFFSLGGLKILRARNCLRGREILRGWEGLWNLRDLRGLWRFVPIRALSKREESASISKFAWHFRFVEPHFEIIFFRVRSGYLALSIGGRVLKEAFALQSFLAFFSKLALGFTDRFFKPRLWFRKWRCLEIMKEFAVLDVFAGTAEFALIVWEVAGDSWNVVFTLSFKLAKGLRSHEKLL